jgi:hypothetical protein
MVSSMNCSECRNLYRIYERRNTQYHEARSAAFFQVSTQIAVRKYGSLQRALSDLQEQQAECPWAIAAEYFVERWQMTSSGHA